MSRLTSSTAVKPPNFLVTLRIVTKGRASASRQGRVSAASVCWVIVPPARAPRPNEGGARFTSLAGAYTRPGARGDAIHGRSIRLGSPEPVDHFLRRVDGGIVQDILVHELP